MGAILGPFDIDPAHGIHSSPLLTRPKDTDKRRVILNLSHPKSTSLNDQVDRLRFDGITFRLKFPSIDNITEEILRVGEGVTLAKIDVSRAFRNLRIDPGDALNFVIQWQGRQYLDAAAAFGWVHRSGAFQMTSDAIAYLMAKEDYKMFPYIDDYMLVTHRDQANDASYWAHQSILIHCDNMAVVQVIQSGRSQDGFLSVCLRNIWLFMAAFDIDLHITHIQGRNNIIADALSRSFSEACTNVDIIQSIREKCVFETIPLQYFQLNFSL